MQSERRFGERKSIELDVEIMLPQHVGDFTNVLHGTIRNVSCQGVQLQVPVDYAAYFRPSSLGDPIEILYYDGMLEGAVVAEYKIQRILVGRRIIRVACHGVTQKDGCLWPFVNSL